MQVIVICVCRIDLRNIIFLNVICSWHTGTTLGIMVWSGINYNSHLTLMFVNEMLKCTEHCTVHSAAIFFNRNLMCSCYLIYFKRASISPYLSFEHAWNTRYFTHSTCLQILYSINRCKKHGIIYHRIVFTICIIACM